MGIVVYEMPFLAAFSVDRFYAFAVPQGIAFLLVIVVLSVHYFILLFVSMIVHVAKMIPTIAVIVPTIITASVIAFYPLY